MTMRESMRAPAWRSSTARALKPAWGKCRRLRTARSPQPGNPVRQHRLLRMRRLSVGLQPGGVFRRDTSVSAQQRPRPNNPGTRRPKESRGRHWRSCSAAVRISGCLELTCENTFTVLPYIDLVNEVMESFVVHLDKYHTDPAHPQAGHARGLQRRGRNHRRTAGAAATHQLPGLLHSQERGLSVHAALPPADRRDSDLPEVSGHQPLRTAGRVPPPMRPQRSRDFRRRIGRIEGPARQVLDRAADAEFLGLTQEEYIILTKRGSASRDTSRSPSTRRSWTTSTGRHRCEAGP